MKSLMNGPRSSVTSRNSSTSSPSLIASPMSDKETACGRPSGPGIRLPLASRWASVQSSSKTASSLGKIAATPAGRMSGLTCSFRSSVVAAWASTPASISSLPKSASPNRESSPSWTIASSGAPWERLTTNSA